MMKKEGNSKKQSEYKNKIGKNIKNTKSIKGLQNI